jgi:hypothetical protein
MNEIVKESRKAALELLKKSFTEIFFNLLFPIEFLSPLWGFLYHLLYVSFLCLLLFGAAVRPSYRPAGWFCSLR